MLVVGIVHKCILVLALTVKAQSIGTVEDGVLTCNNCCKDCYYPLDLVTVLPTIPEDLRPAITKIKFNDNNILSISTEVFRNFSNCIELNMAYNSISYLEYYAFSGMESLQKLNLTGNRFKSLRPGYFMGPSELKQLYIQNSGVHAIPFALLGIPNLEILRLDGHPEMEVLSGAFTALTNLKQLNLSGGGLERIETGMFQGLHNLVRLELQGNSISGISEGSFDDMEKLKVLYLDTNDLEELLSQESWDPGYAFRMPGLSLFTKLKSLQVLSINNNTVKELTVGVFTGLESPQILRLNNNNISSVERGTFSGLNRLKHLELNFNNLKEISDGMFDGLNFTDELKIFLGNNNLTTIPCTPFAQIPRPMTLDISENPLICDSSLCWLRQKVETGSIKWPNL